MKRAPLAAVPVVLVLAAVAAADEYTVQAVGGIYVEPPALVSATNPDGATLIADAASDQQTAPVTLPFEFQFFGRSYDSAAVSDDGWLAFGSAFAGAPSNVSLPSTAQPNAFVAPLWDDLRLGKGSIVTFSSGAAPNRTFVVAWSHVASARTSDHDDLSFEVLLHEGSGVVEIAYSTKGKWIGLSFTAGIENETGTRAFGGPTKTNTNSGRPSSDQRFTPNATTFTGKITRDRPIASTSGLGSTTQAGLPEMDVVGADVELVREDTEETIAAGRTDATGAFTLVALGLDGAPRLSLDLLASGEESFVTGADGKTWKRRIATGMTSNGTPAAVTVKLDASVDGLDPNFRKALNIQQAAHTGFSWAGAAFDASGLSGAAARKVFPPVEIRWTPGGGTASGYAPATSTASARMTIADVAVANTTITPDAYDDDVVLREYAQHLLASMAAFPGALAAHVWTPPPPPAPPATAPPGETETTAFVDGFSFWFAAAVQRRAQFIDTINSTTATVFDLEGPTPAAHGLNVAGAVAASLWDLVDPADDDAFVGSLPDTGYAVLTTLDKRTIDATSGVATLPSGTTSWTTSTFFDAWRAKRSAAETSASARIFIRQGTLSDDTFEPNDQAGEEKPFPAGQSKATGLVLNAGDEDRFSFTVGNATYAVAVSFPDAAAVEVSILDPSMAVIATSASTSSPVVATLPANSVPGTYVARIVWKSGGAAHYTLSIFNPPVLVTVLPTRWTAGFPYSQTLTATGGVPPVTFALADSTVPGLSLVGGTRIAGTPTTPGDYVLSVTMTDSSGAGPLPAGDQPLHVDEALTLPSVFGLRADAPVDVDVGHGGTDATWTPVELPPADSGLVLSAAGHALHLAGTTGGPRSITISAGATDAIGATLLPTECAVVVCAPLATAAGANLNVEKDGEFGYWFDAIAASRMTISLRFSKSKTPPSFLALVDDRGDAMSLPNGVSDGRNGAITIAGVVLPRTSTYFVVFQASQAFSGTVSGARTRIRPPTRLSGVVNLASVDARGDVPFTAIGGSTVRVVLQSAPTPGAALPDAIEILKPDGSRLEPLPTGRVDKAGRRKTVRGIRLPTTGDYVLRIGGDGATTGPIVYEVVIVPPKKGAFSID